MGIGCCLSVLRGRLFAAVCDGDGADDERRKSGDEIVARGCLEVASGVGQGSQGQEAYGENGGDGDWRARGRRRGVKKRVMKNGCYVEKKTYLCNSF